MDAFLKKTKDAFVTAGQSTQRAGRNAILNVEISRLRGQAMDIKKAFGPAVFEAMAKGDTEERDRLFEEAREKVQRIDDEIARKQAEMAAKPAGAEESADTSATAAAAAPAETQEVVAEEEAPTASAGGDADDAPPPPRPPK